jgi:manganese/zinc/iron transport system permease protein
VFFGAGVVLLTVIQTLGAGRQAGLETFLLGATAGMLRADALVIALGGGLVLALAFLLRRPMLMVAFDPGYATAQGMNVRRIELAMMALAMAITVVGLKIVGLILIVALLIIPPAAARFWTDRAGGVIALAGLIGAVSGYGGAAISATAPGLPTGPVIVLLAAAIFAASFLGAPRRGVLAVALRRHKVRV